MTVGTVPHVRTLCVYPECEHYDDDDQAGETLSAHQICTDLGADPRSEQQSQHDTHDITKRGSVCRSFDDAQRAADADAVDPSDAATAKPSETPTTSGLNASDSNDEKETFEIVVVVNATNLTASEVYDLVIIALGDIQGDDHHSASA